MAYQVAGAIGDVDLGRADGGVALSPMAAASGGAVRVRVRVRLDGQPLGAFDLVVLFDAARLRFDDSAAGRATVVSKGFAGGVLAVALVAGHPGALCVTSVGPGTPGLDELALWAGIAPAGSAVLQRSNLSPRARPLGAVASPQAPRAFVAATVI
jgi:hypothetical protein